MRNTSATKKSNNEIEIEPFEQGEFVDVPGAARFLLVSEASVRRYLTKKVLTRYKVLGRTLLRTSEVRNLVKVA